MQASGLDPPSDRFHQPVAIILASDNALPYDEDAPAKAGEVSIFDLIPPFVSG